MTRRGVLLGGAAAVLASVPACGSEESPRRGAKTTVTVLTGAGFQGREAPILAARAQGWFAAEGLDVRVLPGKGTSENLKLLAAGQAVFATLDVNAAMIEYSKAGGIRDFRLTSVLHQRNLACFVALASSGIKIPADLAGKRLSALPGGINYLLFPSYARLAGFDHSRITWVNNAVPTQHAALLAARRVDAISQFVPAVDSVRAVARQDVTVLPFADHLGDLHGSAIAVTQATARTKPDLVRRFNRALLRGLRYAVDDPEQAAAAYAAQPETRGQTVASAASELRALRGYVTPVGTGTIGHFDLSRVARNIAILQGAKAIGPGLTPQDIIVPELVE